MPRIYSPNENYNGISAGVEFINGVGAVETSNTNAINWLLSKGYSKDDTKHELSQWDKLTKGELIGIASTMTIDTENKTKQELVSLIESKVSAL